MRLRNRGFTLLELLIVLAIISVLVGLLMAVLGRAREQAKRTQVLTFVKSVEHAATSFQMTYSRWPWDVDGKTLAQKLSATDIFAELAPGNGTLAAASYAPLVNAQRNEYLGIPPALIKDGRVTDPWGNELEFFWNPDTRSVVIVSAGPNRLNETIDASGTGSIRPSTPQTDDLTNL